MWLYESYRQFVLEASGAYTRSGRSSDTLSSDVIDIVPGRPIRRKLPIRKWPPVIVANTAQMEEAPMLEGRHRQQLPRVPGRIRGLLLAGTHNNENFSQEHLAAWFVPCRIGMDKTIHISIKSKNKKTVLHFDVSEWPTLYDDQRSKQRKIIRRAAYFLQIAPDLFATVTNITKAYSRLEADWNDPELGDKDPLVELLLKQARELHLIFEDLLVRPRAILSTEHRMLKLQNVRRTDAKTLKWLLAQPGRNIAERAGSRQRIKAPKRYETINTLENQVLRSFASLTERTTQALLINAQEIAPHEAILEAHHFRARQIETMLRVRNVPEAPPYVRPNYPLRFDPRYKKIWRSWLELRNESYATELDWMWQHQTFMEILGLRASMLFCRRTHNPPHNGIIAHFPVLKISRNIQNQGCYLNSHGIRATYRIRHDRSEKDEIYQFRTVNTGDDLPLGTITSINFTANSFEVNANLWWNTPEFSDNSRHTVGVETFPWNYDEHNHKWEDKWEDDLNKWIDCLLS